MIVAVHKMVARAEARYLGLARRERALAVLAVLVLIAGLGELMLIEPPLRARARLERQMAAQEVEQAALAQSLLALPADPGGALRTQLQTLEAQLRKTDSEFEALQNGLVQPQHMGALLQSLLAEHRGLRLLRLRSLPVTALDDGAAGTATKPAATADKALALAPAAPAASAGAAAAGDAWLFRHAVEIRVQGSYADMVAYLQALEALPRRVRWGDLEIDARNYPASSMTVTIFTVSPDKSWWIL